MVPSVLCLVLAPLSLHFLWPLIVTLLLAALGTWDLLQKQHSLLRNHPIVGHLRFLLEDTGPELRQYIVESNTEGAPFNRDQRSLMYQRAKNVTDKKAFGTEQKVYESGYVWLSHSMAPKPLCVDPSTLLRVVVGEGRCAKPYSASVYNVFAMSYGSLSPNAILALNEGAKRGGFFHDTGEGGVSRYHREPGGDLVWQIGTGYFGCRDERGRFDRASFSACARDEQVKMIELKLSQGAKPGHGGSLPAGKITPEIAEARKIPLGRDCVSRLRARSRRRSKSPRRWRSAPTGAARRVVSCSRWAASRRNAVTRISARPAWLRRTLGCNERSCLRTRRSVSIIFIATRLARSPK